MASSNTTLTSLWIDDGAQGSPLKTVVGTPSKVMSSNGAELKDDVLRFYKDTGLENMAREAGILDANGEFATIIKQENLGTQQQHQHQHKTVHQVIAVPVSMTGASPMKYKVEPTYIAAAAPRISAVSSPGMISGASPVILGTPQRVMAPTHQQIMTPKSVLTPAHLHDHTWSSGRKRTIEYDLELSDSKRRKGEKGGKGLRHFSMKVCEKVQKKGTTSYNEVADELVSEFTDPSTINPADASSYDQKNIRRRVYDALNVLMAMNIISKEKKEIKWLGLPTNSAQECQNLQIEKQRREQRIAHKTQQLQELILQQIAFKNLVQRNRQQEITQGSPTSNSAIQLPFIIVNTNKKTVIDCSISNDKYEYLFNFDNTFEIHDDIEVLKRMGMAYGLERGRCSVDDMRRAVKMVPKALEPYVLELAKANGSGGLMSLVAGPSTHTGPSSSTAATYATVEHTLLDNEVAMATAHGLSRQSSIGSYSDTLAPSVRESPEEEEVYSEESDSERSSPGF